MKWRLTFPIPDSDCPYAIYCDFGLHEEDFFFFIHLPLWTLYPQTTQGKERQTMHILKQTVATSVSAFEVGSRHFFIVKCGGTYQQEALTNSRTRKVDHKVLQEIFLYTFGKQWIYLEKKFFKKNRTIFFVVVIFRFLIFIYFFFIIKFTHEKKLNQIN